MIGTYLLLYFECWVTVKKKSNEKILVDNRKRRRRRKKYLQWNKIKEEKLKQEKKEARTDYFEHNSLLLLITIRKGDRKIKRIRWVMNYLYASIQQVLLVNQYYTSNPKQIRVHGSMCTRECSQEGRSIDIENQHQHRLHQQSTTALSLRSTSSLINHP